MKRLLAVGPLPPPPSGSTVSFQVFLEALAEQSSHPEKFRTTSQEAEMGQNFSGGLYNLQVDVIDTSPKHIKENTSITSIGNLMQAARFSVRFCAKVRRADRAIIFGSNGFLLSMTPLMVLAAKVLRRPCYVRSFGGSLDQFHDGLQGVLQRVLRFGLLGSDGLIVETKLLYDFFQKLGGDKVHYVPGYRAIDAFDAQENGITDGKDRGAKLRLLFISWVREEKGAFVLLEALRNLTPEEQENVECDIYGPIVEVDRERFVAEIEDTTSATYKGVIDPHDVLPLMKTYDALVFPTFYQGEGQPGVVLETMVAGIPPITTNFRSIPEVVEDGVNGLLVEPQNAAAVTEAIQKLYHDRDFCMQLGANNRARCAQYDTKRLIPMLMAIIEDRGTPSDLSVLQPSPKSL